MLLSTKPVNRERCSERSQGAIPAFPLFHATSYYLADKNDGVRIAKLREMGYPVHIICKLIEEPNPDGVRNVYLLIASSNNYFPHEGAGGVRDRYIDPPANVPIPIYYRSPDGHGNEVRVRLE